MNLMYKSSHRKLGKVLLLTFYLRICSIYKDNETTIIKSMTTQSVVVREFNNSVITIYGAREEDHLFKVSDIGNALDIPDTRVAIRDHDDDEVRTLSVLDSNGKIHKIEMLTMLGLYKVLHNSTKEIAKQFKKWVYEVVDELTNYMDEIQMRFEHDTKRQMSIREDTLIEIYHYQSVFYIGSIQGQFVKYGWTNNIKDVVEYNKRELGDFILEYVMECEQIIELEDELKNHMIIMRRNCEEIFNGKFHTDLIRVDDHLTIEDVRTIATKLKENTIRRDKEYAEMKHKKRMLELEIKLKTIELENVTKQMDMERKRMEYALERQRLDIQLAILDTRIQS